MAKKRKPKASKDEPQAAPTEVISTPASEQITQPLATPPVNKEPEEPVPSATADGVLRVVSVEPLGHEMRVIVEGADLERLTGTEARKLAFEQRLKVGMANAGVEAVAGTFVPDEEQKAAADEGRKVQRWHREFRLVNMI